MITTDTIFRRVRELDKRYMNWDAAHNKWMKARTERERRDAWVFVEYWKRRYFELLNSKEFPT